MMIILKNFTRKKKPKGYVAIVKPNSFWQMDQVGFSFCIKNNTIRTVSVRIKN